MEIITDYEYAIIDGADCCPFVNRNRHDVDQVGYIKDGEPVTAYCSWCGKRLPIQIEDFLESDGRELSFSPVSDSRDGDKVRILFHGKVFEKRFICH